MHGGRAQGAASDGGLFGFKGDLLGPRSEQFESHSLCMLLYVVLVLFCELFCMLCFRLRPSAEHSNWNVRPGYRDTGHGKLRFLVAPRQSSFLRMKRSLLPSPWRSGAHVPNRSRVSGMYAGTNPKPTRSWASTSCPNTCRPGRPSRMLVTGSFVRSLRSIGCKPAGSMPGAWL